MLRRHRHLPWLLVLGSAAGCYQLAGFADLLFDDPQEQPGPTPFVPLPTFVPRTVTPLTGAFADKMDLLLVVDNSPSMTDKRAVEIDLVTDLVDWLLNPPCLDADDYVASRPASWDDECAATRDRAFEPFPDMHVAIVSTSLGGHGADACGSEPTQNDRGRLVARNPDGTPSEQTYEDLGFLSWDPLSQYSPPGDSVLEELTAKLGLLIDGVGTRGCPYEAALESWYRFVVDPDPYESIDVGDAGISELHGTDETLLQQRRDFLRSDSVVLVVMLTDENDGSIRDGDRSWVVAQQQTDAGPYRMARPSPSCAQDPDDVCCLPCDEPDPPSACVPDRCGPLLCLYDPAMAGCEGDPRLSLLEDHPNLRCYDQRRRFGADYLYEGASAGSEQDRYRRGLTETRVEDRHGVLVPNPLLTSDDGGTERPEDRVLLLGLVGVPWQDIARTDPGGLPSLAEGVKTHEELVDGGVWDVILAPLDPHMVESVEPRTGSSPITGTPLMPSDAGAMADPISGHEREIPERDGLQYACVFDLPEAHQIDCTSVDEDERCDCRDPGQTHDPVCQAPDGSYSTIQRRARAHPGIRQLALLRDLGPRGFVGSICPGRLDNRDDRSAADYGYRPMLGPVMARLRELRTPQFCLAESRTADDQGRIACSLIEAKDPDVSEGYCDEEGEPKEPLAPELVPAIHEADPDVIGWTLCTVPQLDETSGLGSCQSNPGKPIQNNGSLASGWCYLEPFAGVGEWLLTKRCGTSPMVRVVGRGRPMQNSKLFLLC